MTSLNLRALVSCEIFGRVPPDDLRRIQNHSVNRSFAKGSSIYLPPDQSDSVYLLSGGLVRLCHLTMEGKQSIINLVEPGELFGEFGLFGLGPAEEYAEVVEAASVIQIPGEELRQLMRHYPEVSQRLMLLMAKRRRRLERRIKSLLFQSNRQRLVYLLLELAENYGGVAGDGIRLRIRLSHQDLANMIGSTRESVTVLLGELQNEGLIKVGRRNLVITACDQLAACVDRPVPANLARQTGFPGATGG